MGDICAALQFKMLERFPKSSKTKFCHGQGSFSVNRAALNEENSPTFDCRVSPLVGAATQESNVWVLSVMGRKKIKINCTSFGFRAYIKQSYSNNAF
jgi:hypothetical protein